MKKLSVIVPCYNEEGVTSKFYDGSIEYIKECTDEYELIFVNDGSKDNTLNELISLKERDSNISVIDFSRNFGKEAAMLAGLKESTGERVVIMDADLQDPPKLLPEMYSILDSGEYDSCATYRVDRKGEPPIRSFFARRFYKMINKMTDVEIVDGARDYRMMTRQMVDSILDLPERNRFSKGIFAWVGYRTKYIEFENVERIAGETKWNFWGLFRYAIEGIVSFTTVPLRFATLVGALSSAVGFLWMIYIVVKALAIGDPVPGYPSLIVVICLLGGIQLLALGIVGEYLAKTYTEVKARPNYIVKRKY